VFVAFTVGESPMPARRAADERPTTVLSGAEVTRMPATRPQTTTAPPTAAVPRAAEPTGGVQGWPAQAFAFYVGLEADNSKTHWSETRANFEQAVRAPLVAFAAAVQAEFGPMHLFRPHRDVRFSK